ncbi:MAG: hypothetical protein SGJ10_08305 [Bacteroidota bacterium]|nr:hypothetical protein [Bacteroidota bacterium]
MKKYIILIWLGTAISLFVCSCKKNVDTKNPYDSINRNIDTTKSKTSIDSNSIVGLHTFIFATKCAIPSCHGGPFEPDFRTPLSSYNTLVYQKVIKNTAAGKYTYRVIPGDTAMSWLHERLVTDDSVLGRMPRYMPALNANEMYHINKWIMDGAKDVNGIAAVKPNNNIQLIYYVALDAAYKRIDTLRLNNGYPFAAPQNKLIHLYFYLTDDETKSQNFKDCKAKFSYSQNNFSSAVELPAVIDTVLYPGYPLWRVDVNTSNFTPGKQVYMRYYGRDPDHTAIVEFPNENASYYYYSYYSLIVK